MAERSCETHRGVAIVIPARFGSTRLPGKPLLDLLGKPMIQHVYERAREVRGVQTVIVATDDMRVATAVRAFGGEAVMTGAEHVSGTERIVEILRSLSAALIVNLQGDEPLIRPGDIETLIEGMHGDPDLQVGTLCHPVSGTDAQDPNTVKVVLNDRGEALYFSRAAIPHPRDTELVPAYLKHVGIYAYRRELLARYAEFGPSALEAVEKLEQLRLLSAGVRIRAWEVEPTGPGVDTPACLELVRRMMSGTALPASSTPSLDSVRLLITDVDGVMTDGGLYWNENGECMKRFHARDGLGIRLLQGCGVQVAVLSGRDSPSLRRRVADLGIVHAEYGNLDKAEGCRALMARAGVLPAHTVFVGDDSIDLSAFEACGWSFATADAPPYVKAKATRVLATCGGSGALRELADTVLLAKGRSEVYSTVAGLRSVLPETPIPVQ